MKPGAELNERESPRIGVALFGNRQVYHRPPPSLNSDAGAVAGIRNWLPQIGVEL